MFFNAQDQQHWERGRQELFDALDAPFGAMRTGKVQKVCQHIQGLQKQLYNDHKKFYKLQNFNAQQGMDKVRVLTDRFLLKPSGQGYRSARLQKSVIYDALVDVVQGKDDGVWQALLGIIDGYGQLADGYYTLEHVMDLSNRESSVQQIPSALARTHEWMIRLWQEQSKRLKYKHMKTLLTRYLLYACTQKNEQAVKLWIGQGAPIDQKVHVQLGQTQIDFSLLDIEKLSQADCGGWKLCNPMRLSGIRVSSNAGGLGEFWEVPLWHYALSVGQCAPLLEMMPKMHIDAHEQFQILIHLLEFKNNAQDIDAWCGQLHAMPWDDNDVRLSLYLVEKHYHNWSDQKQGQLLEQTLRRHAARWQKECLEEHVLPMMEKKVPLRRL